MSQTPLRSKFTLWVLDEQKTTKQQTVESFEDKQKAIVTFGTVEQFWQFFQYLNKPSKMSEQTELYLFKQGIKPLWEDPHNEKGVYYKITIQKQKVDKLWENAIFALISPAREVALCINGVRLKIKEDFCMLQIWMNSRAHDNVPQLKQYMKDSLQIYDDRVFAFYFFSFLVKGIKSYKDTYPKETQNRQGNKEGGGGGRYPPREAPPPRKNPR